MRNVFEDAYLYFMSSILVSNVKTLVNVRQHSILLRGKELADLPCLQNGYMIVEDGIISYIGSMFSLKNSPNEFKHHINAQDQFVLPAWCDSHTHLVFAGSREHEFVDKIKGLTYAEIAAKGGGILNSENKLQETSEDQLFNQAWKRLQEVSSLGTGAIEIKSGYGLSVEGELKMLRVIKRLKQKAAHSNDPFMSQKI